MIFAGSWGWISVGPTWSWAWFPWRAGSPWGSEAPDSGRRGGEEVVRRVMRPRPRSPWRRCLPGRRQAPGPGGRDRDRGPGAPQSEDRGSSGGSQSGMEGLSPPGLVSEGLDSRPKWTTTPTVPPTGSGGWGRGGVRRPWWALRWERGSAGGWSLNGEIHHGASDAAGEFGHMTIDSTGTEV